MAWYGINIMRLNAEQQAMLPEGVSVENLTIEAYCINEESRDMVAREMEAGRIWFTTTRKLMGLRKNEMVLTRRGELLSHPDLDINMLFTKIN